MTAQELYEQSIQNYEEKNYEQALAFINQAIELDNSDVRFWYEKATLLWKLKNPEKALKACDQAISLDDKYVKAWHGKGNFFNELEQYNSALTAYDRAIELNETYAPSWHGKGIIFRKLEQYSSALAAYDKAIELDDKLAYPWYGKGGVYNSLKQYNSALSAFDKAIELDEEFAPPWNGKGNLFNELGQYDSALKSYDKAIELDDKLAYPWNGKGKTFTTLGQYDSALAAYDKAIELDDKHAPPWNGKGNVFNELRQYDSALKSYNKAIELDDKYAYPWSGKGTVFSTLGQYDSALVAYDKAIELNDKYAPPWHGKGDLYAKQGHFSLAQRYFLHTLFLEINLRPLKGYLYTWNHDPRHPFFLQETFGLLLGTPHESIYIQNQVATICRHINFFLAYLKETEKYKNLPPTQWLQFQALINHFMGHPIKAYQIIKNDLLPNTSDSLQDYYYLIMSCYEFLEDEKPYLKKALEIAKQYYQESTTKEEVNQRYYAALIFELNEELEKAIECLAPIWQTEDFLPVAYLYLHLRYAHQRNQIELNRDAENIYQDWSNDDDLEILGQKDFIQIGKYILEVESKELPYNTYAYGFQPYYIVPDLKEWWHPFYHYAHYFEIKNAITLLAFQAENYLDNDEVEEGYILSEFWNCFAIDEADIIIMQNTARKKAREKIGIAFLHSAEQHLKGISENISFTPEELDQSINYVLHETGATSEATKRAYDELRQTQGTTSNALIHRIASKIEAKELGDDLQTYLYLISYFFLSDQLSERDSTFLQFFALYAHYFHQRSIPKFIQGGSKDQVKNIAGQGYDWVTTAVATTNPIIGITMGALKPFAKGVMGELFLKLLKKSPNPKTMMRYAIPTYDRPPYEKMLLAPSFKDAFLEFVGEEQERLGNKFEEVYPLYGFEEWIE